jgi:tetratricopeptide (TPR) repeat protein
MRFPTKSSPSCKALAAWTIALTFGLSIRKATATATAPAQRRLAARPRLRGVSAGPRAAQLLHDPHRLPLRSRPRPRLFENVTTSDPEFAAGWAGLGIAELQYVRHGFGGQIHVMTARRAFDLAYKLDPGSTEANLYRIYMLLSRGEKESARHGIANLLSSAANDWNVHMVAGITLRIDGMYDEALAQFSQALKLNPANAALLLQPPRPRLPVSQSA